MKRRVLSVCIIIWLLLVLGSCGASTTEPEGVANRETAAGTTEVSDYPTETEGYYSGNYESEPIYQKIMEIENCTDPDDLLAIINTLYGEEFSYITLEIDDASNAKTLRYKEPYYDVVCSYTGFNNYLLGEPVVQVDTHLFFRAYQEQPVFMMDDRGTYIVRSYDMHTFADGETASLVSGYVISDLYLSLHGFTSYSDELKASDAERIKAMDFYMELETQISHPTEAGWEEAYENVIADAMLNFPNYQYTCNYTVYDINKDGCPELLLKVGTCEADFEYRFFTFDPKLASATCFQSRSGSHTYPCGLETEQAILLVAGHMGSETVTKATYSGLDYTEETVFSGEVEEYHDFVYLDVYELNDPTGLQWNGNAPDSNNNILFEIKDSIPDETDLDPASIEIISVEYTGDPMCPINVTYRINNIKTVRGCVYLTSDSQAFIRQMHFFSENHLNEYREDGVFDYDLSWMGQGATNYFNINYGYGIFDPNEGWSNSCSLRLYYRLVDDYGTISSETIPESEIYHIYDGDAEIGAWTLHESGDLIEVGGNANSVPFSMNNAFVSPSGYTVYVELVDGIPHFTIDGSYVGAARSTPIEMGNGALFYEIDTANGTFTIDRFPNDEYIVVGTMGNLSDALEGSYYPQ